jgi:hypothetical protein
MLSFLFLFPARRESRRRACRRKASEKLAQKAARAEGVSAAGPIRKI